MKMESFFVIMNKNGDYYSHFKWPGLPRWTGERYMEAWETLEAAQAVIDDMHPEYRDRLQAEVVEAQWFYCLKAECQVLAVRGI
jgi:hypothetical protein